jgi:hypothetical protein
MPRFEPDATDSYATFWDGTSEQSAEETQVEVFHREDAYDEFVAVTEEVAPQSSVEV